MPVNLFKSYISMYALFFLFVALTYASSNASVVKHFEKNPNQTWMQKGMVYIAILSFIGFIVLSIFNSTVYNYRIFKNVTAPRPHYY